MEKQINVGIFDSEYSNRCLIKILSTKILMNVTYFEADNGIDAIDLIKHSIIDICFINLRLSKVDSNEIARCLRSKNSDSRIIALNSVDIAYSNGTNEFDSYVRVGSPKFNEFIRKECINFVKVPEEVI